MKDEEKKTWGPFRFIAAFCFGIMLCFSVQAQDTEPTEPTGDEPPQEETTQEETTSEEETQTWWQKHVDPGLLIESEAGIGLNKGRADQKLEGILWTQVDLKLAGRTDIRAIGRIRFDGFDNLEPGKPTQPEISRASRRAFAGKQVDLELREAFLTTSIGRTLLMLGKQQVVWGQADGLKVLDFVNPQDFQEFILDDFDDARIPLWMVNWEVPVRKANLQLLWVPDRTYHKLPVFGAAYDFQSPYIRPIPPPGIPVTILPVQRPNRFFEDSDMGGRLSAFVKGWDLTFNYLYHYADIPVVSRFIGGSGITVTQTYARTHLAGATFSNAFGSLTVRGELGYSKDRRFLTASLADADGVVKTDELAYVLGFDWFGISDSFLSLQLFQSLSFDHPAGMVRDRTDTNITVLFQRNAMNEKFKAETLWVQNLNDRDGFVRPKVSYEVRTGLKVWGGFDVVYGTCKGLFGQYNRNDRFIAGWEWGI